MACLVSNRIARQLTTIGLRIRASWPLIVTLAICSFAQADVASAQLEGTASKAARQDALRSIPFNEFTHDAYQKLNPVVSRPSVYRRMPIETINCDPDLHVFLVRYPEVIVGIWDLMGVTKVSTQRTGDFTLAASDGEGTTSRIELVYGTPDLHIYYAEGSYDGPLFPRAVRGRCVLVLRSEYGVGRDGKAVVRNQLDTFIKIDNLAADLVAKTVHPLIGKAADHNFVETSRFLSRISEAAESNSQGVRAMASKLDNIDPAVEDRFGQIADVVEDREAIRISASSNGPIYRTRQNSNRPLPSRQ